MKGKANVVLIVIIVLAVAAAGYYFLTSGGNSAATTTTAASSSSGGSFGGSGGSGGMGGQFQQFREDHKWTFQLTRLAHNIGRLDTEKKFPLTPAQAKAVLDVLNPLRKQKSLDQDQAKECIKQLQDILTDDQRNAISTMAPEHQFKREGPPPGAANRPRRPMMDLKAMENFNPFNPPKDSPMAQRGAERNNKLFDALEAKAKSK